MSHAIPAIFDSGVFRPTKPVELAEGTHVVVQVPARTVEIGEGLSTSQIVLQQAEIEEMLAEIESLPIEEPDDGFSGRDHDRVLYGGQ